MRKVLAQCYTDWTESFRFRFHDDLTFHFQLIGGDFPNDFPGKHNTGQTRFHFWKATFLKIKQFWTSPPSLDQRYS